MKGSITTNKRKKIALRLSERNRRIVIALRKARRSSLTKPSLSVLIVKNLSLHNKVSRTNASELMLIKLKLFLI